MVVADYFAMLRLELAGLPFNKAAHGRELRSQLSKRSGPSVEFKHRNISAILVEMGHTYISGYKPSFNYQKLLIEKISSYLNQHEAELIELVELQQAKLPKGVEGAELMNWQAVLAEPPSRSDSGSQTKNHQFIPKRFNFSEREQNNRSLGSSGERFVIEFEKARLQAAGKSDLVSDVQWTSDLLGDGVGYDIRSFDIADESPKYIEVKTTNAGKYQPFYISANELRFANAHEKQWSLYRVFEFRERPKLFTLSGKLSECAHLEPNTFIAGF